MRALIARVREADGLKARPAESSWGRSVVHEIAPACARRGRLLADLGRARSRASPVTPRFAPSEPRLNTDDAGGGGGRRGLVAEPVYVLLERRPLRTLAEPSSRACSASTSEARFPRHARRGGLARVLDPSLGAHEQRAVNARFEVAGDVVRVLPRRPGIGSTVTPPSLSVTAAAYSPRSARADVRLAADPGDVTAEAQALGITRQVSTFTTDMGVSSANRIWNVQLMADYIDGTIIAPGEVFSFNRVVGERTVERGFREGQMIVGSLLLPSIGGGVCQTATTLFNNAFELGLPIVQRLQPQLLHQPLPARARRDRLVGRARPRVQERPGARDPDQVVVHELDADLHVLRHARGPARRRRRRARRRTGASRSDELRVRPVRAGRLDPHVERLEPERAST